MHPHDTTILSLSVGAVSDGSVVVDGDGSVVLSRGGLFCPSLFGPIDASEVLAGRDPRETVAHIELPRSTGPDSRRLLLVLSPAARPFRLVDDASESTAARFEHGLTVVPVSDRQASIESYLNRNYRRVLHRLTRLRQLGALEVPPADEDIVVANERRLLRKAWQALAESVASAAVPEALRALAEVPPELLGPAEPSGSTPQ